MRAIMHLGLMVFILIFGVLFLIYMESAADWVGEKAEKFFIKSKGRWRKIAIRSWESYVKTWCATYLTGAFMIMASIVATAYFRWVFLAPFVVFGATFMIIGLYLRKRKIGVGGYHLICMLIREIRRGERDSFAPLQGPGFWEPDEVHRAFARNLARAKKEFGVTDEEWERWRKDYKEYLEEDVHRVQILSANGELVLLRIFSFPFCSPNKNRGRDIELMCKLADLPASEPIETGSWFEARIRIKDNVITKWVSWEPSKPWPTDEEMKEMMRKFFSQDQRPNSF